MGALPEELQQRLAGCETCRLSLWEDAPGAPPQSPPPPPPWTRGPWLWVVSRSQPPGPSLASSPGGTSKASTSHLLAWRPPIPMPPKVMPLHGGHGGTLVGDCTDWTLSSWAGVKAEPPGVCPWESARSSADQGRRPHLTLLPPPAGEGRPQPHCLIGWTGPLRPEIACWAGSREGALGLVSPEVQSAPGCHLQAFLILPRAGGHWAPSQAGAGASTLSVSSPSFSVSLPAWPCGA